MCYASNEMWQITSEWRNLTTKSRQNRTLGEKATYKYLGILEVDIIKQFEIEGKLKNEYIKNNI